VKSDASGSGISWCRSGSPSCTGRSLTGSGVATAAAAQIPTLEVVASQSRTARRFCPACCGPRPRWTLTGGGPGAARGETPRLRTASTRCCAEVWTFRGPARWPRSRLPPLDGS
jgi:hypothetical protein